MIAIKHWFCVQHSITSVFDWGECWVFVLYYYFFLFLCFLNCRTVLLYCKKKIEKKKIFTNNFAKREHMNIELFFRRKDFRWYGLRLEFARSSKSLMYVTFTSCVGGNQPLNWALETQRLLWKKIILQATYLKNHVRNSSLENYRKFVDLFFCFLSWRTWWILVN